MTGLLEELQLDVPPLAEIGIGNLIARIDHSWDTRDEIRDRIAERVSAITARAKKTNQLLLTCLRSTAA